MAKIQTVKLSKKWKRIGYGAYGRYYRISKTRGIKILHMQADNGYDDILSIDELRSNAFKEFNILKKASKSGCAPKAYRVVKVQLLNGHYSFGIVMQHIVGKQYSSVNGYLREDFEETLNECFLNEETGEYNDFFCVEEHLNEKLQTVGVKHGDLHTGNIIAVIKNRKITKVYAVDFSPECSSFCRKV